ncbi:LytR/AlgR family response regulator transcription factor [Elizabethkingia miricola]|uniref:LytTR family DNA-binding domain-containing protein n=1 Tax=Elizabethkingia miricola TaxID=172045 RepID=A0ABD5BAZ1_ELIMR|nr:LytTR family DNA-binding domain-containing protein [Elizabethkingia miricola]MDQ8750569.1 LytTR family DNA-binding domain-containing protein [Elizabethkingia miricola]NHQ67702.1 LytTR family transcriptional regulator [Elizabethkingia miricola]NHQ71419.1 LytTR family transcriptional regulator [Elizabethkingia miricola]NHQ79433.1 LytTR family transcriptional regulator [Elizabethkingia miricola]OPB90786.1 transcriptional regulator [Elizabethkingia miricola]
MSEKQYTFIKSGKRLIKLNFDEISIIKGLGNYVEIITTVNKKLVYYKSLKDLIENLPEEFMRVHNSFIVNLRNVDYFEDNHLIVNDQKISVAKSYKDCLLNSIEKLLL